ncbi:hypothetical protein [Actibacterium sp. 188UL27-1]|uniref:hypothetical protein n=1 Tax=Actibacterium sp. 188UL27-1 TaxID=2786961 RepID=UPI00195A046D|nr:hypothetical protein [Actibacterium sp. 188UL27-1]MBM7069764.1 hypothetical protein [Actibacterium sp. 188UL27-1]
MPVAAELSFDPTCPLIRRLAHWLEARATGLSLRPQAGAASYRDGDYCANGTAAWAWALGHVNLPFALIGAVLHLVLAAISLICRPFARSNARHA